MATRERRGLGSIQHLGGDRWRLWMSSTAPDGQRLRHSKVVRVDGRRTAERELVRFISEQRQRTTRKGTVGELMEAWLASGPAQANTVAEWRGAWERHGLPAIGGTPFGQLEPHRLDRLYRGVTPAVAQKLHTALRLAFAQAVRWGWLADNPVARATVPKAERRRIVPPSPQDVERLIGAASNGDRMMVALAAETGLRRGEMCGLRWSDIDAGYLTVNRVVVMVDHLPVVREETKTAASRRRVSLSAGLTQLLERQRTGGADFVFGAGQVPGNPEQVSRRFAQLAARAGVKCRLHDLRHFMVTQALAAGFDWRTIATRGGWSNPAVLMSTYAHFVPARDADLAQHLGGLVAAVSTGG